MEKIKEQTGSKEYQKLHLGCFDKPLGGWYNTDITTNIFISRIPGLPFLLFKSSLISRERFEQHQEGIFNKVHYLNVTKVFPFEKNTFDYVFISHMLEHLYPWQAVFCMHEVNRVLKDGGIVRISVPDLDRIIANYHALSSHQFLLNFFECDQRNFKNQHHWQYNEESLTELLRDKSGFAKVYRCKFQQGKCIDLDIIDNRPESLFMEAQK